MKADEHKNSTDELRKKTDIWPQYKQFSCLRWAASIVTKTQITHASECEFV